ncbi:hypothetical protein [Burkholderia sp. F1]|uniref:hypothetical protein n=1 Tax=Burkholderia sp. F1 TaxID=3366817 RepID=UPI003D75B2A3
MQDMVVSASDGKVFFDSPAGQIELKGNLAVNGQEGGSFKFPTWSKAPLKAAKDAMNFGFSE